MKKILQFILFIIGINLAIILAPVLIVGYVIYQVFSDGDDDAADSAVNESRTWESYPEYLDSDVWSEKRRVVMTRADGRCENEDCDNHATEVHHLTYRYDLGNTPIKYLEALCGPCHDARHPQKPKRFMTPEEATRALEELGSQEEASKDSG